MAKICKVIPYSKLSYVLNSEPVGIVEVVSD